MPVYHSTFDVGWYRTREEFVWSTWLSLSCQRGPPTNPWEKMVYGTSRYSNSRWHSPFRINFHWNVRIVFCIRYKLSEWREFSISFLFHRYFIFTSFWAYKIYYVYGFMLLVVLILIVVTVCVTIVCTYFLLNAEDYRWWDLIQFIKVTNKLLTHLIC